MDWISQNIGIHFYACKIPLAGIHFFTRGGYGMMNETMMLGC